MKTKKTLLRPASALVVAGMLTAILGAFGATTADAKILEIRSGRGVLSVGKPNFTERRAVHGSNPRAERMIPSVRNERNADGKRVRTRDYRDSHISAKPGEGYQPKERSVRTRDYRDSHISARPGYRAH